MFQRVEPHGGKRGGPSGAGGESFELGDKAGAEEEGEALRVAKWISWRKERRGGSTSLGGLESRSS